MFVIGAYFSSKKCKTRNQERDKEKKVIITIFFIVLIGAGGMCSNNKLGAKDIHNLHNFLKIILNGLMYVPEKHLQLM